MAIRGGVAIVRGMNGRAETPPQEMTSAQIDDEIGRRYRTRDAAQTMTDLTREHRRLRALQKEEARRIEERYRAAYPKTDVLERAAALLAEYANVAVG
jgi:phage host-nuclease inhibitor protein Gam